MECERASQRDLPFNNSAPPVRTARGGSFWSGGGSVSVPGRFAGVISIGHGDVAKLLPTLLGVGLNLAKRTSE